MRKFTISPATIDAMRAAALAAARQQGAAQVPLYLPAFDSYALPQRALPDFSEFDAEEARVVAGGYTLGEDEDDDFY